MRKHYANLLGLFPLVLFTFALQAQPSISYSTVTGGLSLPVEVVNAGDGTNRLFIVQQTGTIRVYDPANGGLQSTPFLNVGSLIKYTAGGEQGLLSLAFHPAYETNGYFYIYYNNTAGDVTVARYRANGTSNTAESGSGVVLLTIPKPFDNHNGGHLQFAKDSTLYFATGDGGNGNDPNNNAQNTLSRLGKMLRLKVYTDATVPYFEAPDDNPFIGNNAYDSLIWAYGLRNPYRWSFDRFTGDMWIGDVGQNAKEEIDYRPASSSGGENYGWRCYEGSIRTPGVTPCDPPNYVPPVYDYDNPGSGSSSVIGGYVYRGTEFGSLYGYYIAADVYSGNVYLLKSNGAGGFTASVKTGLQNFVVGFGEAENGSLYAVSQATNTLYKIVVLPPLAVAFSGFTGKRTADGVEVKWTTASEQNLSKFEIGYSRDGNNFSPIGQVAASGNGAGSSYSFIHRNANTNDLFYRLRTVENDGKSSYSSVVKISAVKSGIQIYPTTVRGNLLTIQTNEPLSSLQLSNANGSVVFKKDLAAAIGQIELRLPTLPKGVYMATVVGKAITVQKLLIE